MVVPFGAAVTLHPVHEMLGVVDQAMMGQDRPLGETGSAGRILHHRRVHRRDGW